MDRTPTNERLKASLRISPAGYLIIICMFLLFIALQLVILIA